MNAFAFWQEMCQADPPPPPPPLTDPTEGPCWKISALLIAFYHLWNTSHICQNRSMEFKLVSGGKLHGHGPAHSLPRWSFLCDSVCVLGWWEGRGDTHTLLNSLLNLAGGKHIKASCVVSCQLAPPHLFSLSFFRWRHACLPLLSFPILCVFF